MSERFQLREPLLKIHINTQTSFLQPLIIECIVGAEEIPVRLHRPVYGQRWAVVEPVAGAVLRAGGGAERRERRGDLVVVQV